MNNTSRATTPGEHATVIFSGAIGVIRDARAVVTTHGAIGIVQTPSVSVQETIVATQ